MGTEYADTIKAGYDEWKENMGDAPRAPEPDSPAAAPSPTPTTEPDSTASADPRSPTPRARDESGRFARADNPPASTAPAPSEPAEPFAGYNALSPQAREHFDRMAAEQRRLTGERDDFRLRLYRQQGEYRRLQQDPRRAQGQPGVQPGPGRTAQPGPVGSEARRQAAALPPGAHRDAVVRQIDKWEAHAKAYPDDAAAIGQYVTAMADDLKAGLDPLLAVLPEVQNLRNEINELRGFADSVREERHAQFVEGAQRTLDEETGGLWRQAAGWEDADGNPVPPEKHAWHPEFLAWLGGHDPDIQSHYWECLSSASPRVAAIPYKAFAADVFGVNGPAAPNAPAPTPGANRRRENLRDVAPGRARTLAPSQGAGSGDGRPETDYSRAIREGHDEWKRLMGEA